MPDSANETLTADEYRRMYGEGAKPSQDGAEGALRRFECALGVDPGTDTGLAWTDGEQLITNTSGFWAVEMLLRHGSGSGGTRYVDNDDTCIILEAPYKSRPGMSAGRAAIAYRSGQVAREAELLCRVAEQRGYCVIEHDPSQQSQKWDSGFTHQVVGDWEGPDQSDVRDAIRLLFFYDFI
jgi:hypothetical protein